MKEARKLSLDLKLMDKRKEELYYYKDLDCKDYELKNDLKRQLKKARKMR